MNTTNTTIERHQTMNNEHETQTSICECGTAFQSERILGTLWRPTMCEACEDIMFAKRESEREQRRIKEIAEKIEAATERTIRELNHRTPDRFQDTEITHPQFNRELWERVKAWQPKREVPWLGLVGESGGSKTRIAYLLLRKIVLESITEENPTPISFEVATSAKFTEAISTSTNRARAARPLRPQNRGDCFKDMARA